MRRRPLVAIKSVADAFAGAQRMALPVELGVSIESLTLAGATLQRVSGDFASEPDGWDIETLEFRAPGLAQVALAGRLGAVRRKHFVCRAYQGRGARSACTARLAHRSCRRPGHHGRFDARRGRYPFQ